MKKSFGPRTLIYPTPVWVIETYDKAGKPNVMTYCMGRNLLFQAPMRRDFHKESNLYLRKHY